MLVSFLERVPLLSVVNQWSNHFGLSQLEADTFNWHEARDVISAEICFSFNSYESNQMQTGKPNATWLASLTAHASGHVLGYWFWLKGESF